MDSNIEPLPALDFGRPVTSAGQQTPLHWSGVSCVGSLFNPSLSIPNLDLKQRPTKVHLPTSRLGCSIGLAYQAADASQPLRKCKVFVAKRRGFQRDFFLVKSHSS
jgi:hypothetical protein